MKTEAALSWLADPAVFSVNRLAAHSDHKFYETMEEAEKGASMPLRYDLNGSWKFNYSVNPASRPADFYKTEFDCRSWGNITVPGHIQLQGHGKAHYVNTMYPWDGVHHLRPPEVEMDDNPVGSYVKYFDLPEKFTDSPLYIAFDGVETAFYVWMNGHFVGYSEDSFTPAHFDLTKYAQPGENKLSVEVYQRSTGSWLEDQDFWRFSGIFRDVYLYSVPKIHLSNIKIRGELDENYENGLLKGEFVSNSEIPAGAKLEAALYDKENQLAASGEGELTENGWSIALPVERPHHWSAEDPYLYILYVKVLDENGDLTEVIPQKVGFRRFEMIDKIMHLNGKRIVFKGVNRHEFNHRHGRVVSKEDMLWDIKTMKQHNMNAVRCSHYPNQSWWYELCDEYGLYVIDEMNLETHGSWQKMGAVEPSWNIPGNKPEWEDIVMDRAISMYERHKNHPSVLIWSVGNEAFAGEVILNVSKYFKSVDPGRLVHYEGVFHAREYDETSDMESRMYAKPADIIEYLENDPEKPYISCEYMHAMGNSVGGMYKYTDLEDKYPLYQGGFIWDFIDQALAKKDRYGNEYLAYGGDFGDRPTDYAFCTNGIVFGDRTLSPKMQEVKYLYQNLKIQVEKDSVTIRNDNLFIDTGRYDFSFSVNHEGEEVYKSALQDVKVLPGEKQSFPLNIPDDILQKNGEYCIDVSARLKDDELWGARGYELAFGQHIFKLNNVQEPGSVTHQPEFRVVEGDVNIGVHGLDFSAIFSKQAGFLISLNYGGREMIELPPAPIFWRASTDNDRGRGQDYHSGVWYAASFGRKCTDITTENREDRFEITFTYKVAAINEAAVKVKYEVFADGSIGVTSMYEGADGLPEMPTFGITFKTSADYHQLTWHAMGPDENYSDRNKGARLQVFHNTAAENVSKYEVPQETGNRTGVRWVQVENGESHGIRISSVEEPVECTITPYTPFELENARHHFELPNIHYTVITVAAKQMGVGGDDSWGAPVYQEHQLNPADDHEFQFMIRRV
ncbi:DUF4981 domain-containing protein [Evansella sp. LMS18]|uniref:glycoside hydrolase family 2 TIM barrel-domain containing protein n=1 Tax=Evansella sp. LMS18 TaxID=2924033 RepID=UPI0020D12011|nr:glycoside hydrolase family 2 TIM barrel-domain containing protein [Evansella sp. LMS18]UTR10024.1 DUF4981 domain-containing protein [Evansella sp. LMS18]